MKRIGLIVLAATLIAAEAGAQSLGCPGARHWWDLFEIRKSFDGGSNEAEAGSIGLVNPGKDSQTNWFLDAGVRTRLCEIHLGTVTAGSNPPLLLWYPSFEWHHMSAEPLHRQDATNQGGPALNAELWFGDPDSSSPRMYFVAKGAVVRDTLNETTEKAATLLVSVAQAPPERVSGGFRPGSPIVVKTFRRGIYFPYVGLEYFRQLAITQGEDVIAPVFDGTTVLARVQFEAYPFHHEVIPGNIPFVISGEYTYRRLFKEVATLGTRQLNYLSLSAIWYPDEGQTVGIGLTLDKGRAPETNFVSQQRVALGVKIKR